MDTETYNEMPGANAMSLDLDSRNFLYSTARWGKFMAITGFVFIGIIALAALVVGFFLGSSLSGEGFGGFQGGFVAVLYLLMALLYLFPVIYLYRFSVKMKQGLEARDQTEVSVSFGNLKSLFKFMGVLTIVLLAIYGLLLVFGLMAGAASLF